MSIRIYIIVQLSVIKHRSVLRDKLLKVCLPQGDDKKKKNDEVSMKTLTSQCICENVVVTDYISYLIVQPMVLSASVWITARKSVCLWEVHLLKSSKTINAK